MSPLLAALLLSIPAGALPVFKGENCASCHAAIRDKQPGPASKKITDAGRHDVIVVGGGLSGMTAAHFLEGRDVLVLEADAKAGGRTRTESFGAGLPYPVGSVYTNEPYGAIKTLLDDLKIVPERISYPDHHLYAGGKITARWLSGEVELPSPPYTAEDRKAFARFLADLQTLGKSEKLSIPVEDSDPAALAELDAVLFWDYLAKRYGEAVARIGDLYARDIFGDGARAVSAFAGLLYMAAETEESYTWPGGLGRITAGLAESLGKKVRTGCLVWSVRQDGDGVEVLYTRAGRDYRVRGKAAVVAVPGHVARRIVRDLPAAKREALAGVRYSSYALIPMSLKKVVWKDAFVLWNPAAFFTDVTLPLSDNSPLVKDPDRGQVLVAYAPLGAGEGRRYLLAAEDAEIVSRTVKDLEAMLPESRGQLREARVIRWGHAMPLAYPGYLTKVRPVLAEPAGRLLFAGVDTQLPAIEGAIFSGHQAAQKAAALLGEK